MRAFVTVCGILGAFLLFRNLEHLFKSIRESSVFDGWETAPILYAPLSEPSSNATQLCRAPDSTGIYLDEGQIVNTLENHVYRKDGLLEVNPNGPHPIFELIKHAQESWDEKMKNSSKTLESAVIEYRRRYNRMPPKGFDHWYELWIF